MKLPAPISSSSNSEPTERKKVPAWTHSAYLIRIIDLWTQPWTTAYPEPKRKIMFTFEFPMCKMEYKWEVVPMRSSTSYNMTYWSKEKVSNLRRDLCTMLGKDLTDNDLYSLNLEDLIWKLYTVSIKHNNNYANISSISPAMVGVTVDQMIAEPLIFMMDTNSSDQSFSQSIYDQLDQRIKDKIAQSPEYKSITTKQDIDLPF